MKNIFKNSKRGIIVILTFCILVGIARIGAYAAMMQEPEVGTEETAQELMPRIAKSCDDPLVEYFGSDYEVTSTSGPWQHISGANGITGAYNTSTGYGYVKMSDGSISEFYT